MADRVSEKEGEEVEREIVRRFARCRSQAHSRQGHSALACWTCSGSLVNPEEAKGLREALERFRAALLREQPRSDDGIMRGYHKVLEESERLEAEIRKYSGEQPRSAPQVDVEKLAEEIIDAGYETHAEWDEQVAHLSAILTRALSEPQK